jgi:hypothetical protein
MRHGLMMITQPVLTHNSEADWTFSHCDFRVAGCVRVVRTDNHADWHVKCHQYPSDMLGGAQ